MKKILVIEKKDFPVVLDYLNKKTVVFPTGEGFVCNAEDYQTRVEIRRYNGSLLFEIGSKEPNSFERGLMDLLLKL